MLAKQHLTLGRFVLLTVIGAVTALAYDAWVSRAHSLLGPRPEILLILAACCLGTELRPLQWLRLEEGGQVTASWTFMMAIVLSAPPIVAVAIATGTSVLGDIVSRKSPIKVAFNFSQITLAVSLGAAVFSLTGQGQALVRHTAPTTAWFVAFVAASAGVFVVNNWLTCTVMALHQGLPVTSMLRSVGLASLWTDGVLLSLSPVFVVVAERSVFLVPLLLVTTWTVYRTAELALLHKHEASHDSLTKLPNRRLFDDHLQSTVTSARAAGERVGLVLIDLNDFKGINDRLGHDTGDEVLRSVTSRMNSVRRSSDLLARIGGDEFAVILPRLDSVATVIKVAAQMQAALSAPSVVDGFPVSAQASFGIAVLPDHAADAATLLQRADEAMYAAKESQEGLVVYQLRPDQRVVGRIGLLGDVAAALSGGQFFLEYQPQISLPSGRTVAVEALVRWRHPVAGVLYPSEFIGLAEQTELIGAITEQVLREAFAQCALWHDQGLDLRVAVNISARNLHDVHFPGLVASLVHEKGINPACIDLEITENTVGLDRSTIGWVLNRLRAIGVSISIDDFGTGYSSMAQLRELPVDRIKVDRSFVTNMERDAKDALIVASIVQLGLALGIETVAEGVEDLGVAKMLTDLGCTTVQGWLYGKPMSAEALTRTVRASRSAERLVPDLALENAAS